MRSSIIILLCIFATMVLGCSHAKVFPNITTRLTLQKYEGKKLWLKQSLYSGPFYDDQRFKLAHPNQFESIKYLRDFDGNVVLPPKSDEIIAVGTRATIQKIEWPSFRTQLSRPLFTPRSHPWVYVRFARDRGHVSLERDLVYILVVPSFVKTKITFDKWLYSHFSKQDTNDWLYQMSEAKMQGIIHKYPVVGMYPEELLAAMGPPSSKLRKKGAYLYGNILVFLANNRVKTIQQLSN